MQIYRITTKFWAATHDTSAAQRQRKFMPAAIRWAWSWKTVAERIAHMAHARAGRRCKVVETR